MQNNTEKKGDKINDFVQRNRKVIFLILGIIVFLIVGSVVFLSLKDYLQKKAIAEVEELDRRFTELSSSSGGTVEEADAGDIDALLTDLNAFAKNKSGYAGGKAWSIIARIYSDRKDWPEAENAWLLAAKAGNKTNLAPAAYFNAAVAAEEQGKLEQAIELFGKCVSHPFVFPAAPRAQFSIGRLNEQLNNFPAAIEAYRAVLINWPQITTWANLAHSRIVALEIR